MSGPSCGFEAFSPYWDLFEHGGLNGKIVALREHIKSSVLVLGSGQGLVSRALAELRYEVTSVDISESMIRFAKERRDIETIRADVMSLSLGRRFKTVIVSTGVVTETNVRASTGLLLDNVDRHLDDGGSIILAYFQYSPVTDAFERLGLHGRPSRNVTLLLGCASLEEFKERLIADGHDRAKLDFIFMMYAEELDAHRGLLTEVATRYSELHRGKPPAALLDKLADFAPCYLTGRTERCLLDAFDERFVTIDAVKPDDGMRVLVARRR